MPKSRSTFKIRSFVALSLSLSFLGLPVSGLVNHHYADFPMTVPRHIWMSVHNVLGLLFIVFGIWHVILNRRALVNHLRSISGDKAKPILGREAVLAVATLSLLLILSITHVFLF